LASAFCRDNFIHGGVLILTKETKNFEAIHEIYKFSKEKDIELAAIKTKYGIIMTVYRSPLGDMEAFKQVLQETLDYITSMYSKDNIYIAGDFNINFLIESQMKANLEYLLNSYGLKKTFIQPSRITFQTETCIDNIFSSFHLQEIKTTTVNLHISDHQGQILFLPNQPNTNETSKITYRQISDVNIYNFKQALSSADWSDSYNASSATTAFTLFHDNFTNLIDNCFPIRNKVISNKKKNLNWYTEELRQLRNKLDAFDVIYKVRKDEASLEAYKACKSLYIDRLNTTRKQSNATFINNSSNKSKAMWSVIKRETTNTIKSSPGDGKLTANSLNQYFTDTSKFKALQGQTKDSIELLHNVEVNTTKSMYINFVEIDDIRTIIRRMKNKKSQDIYGFSVSILKKVENELIHPLTYLINMCISQGVFPNELKKAKVVPIHKKGKSDECENYRPISILPTLSKIFETLLKVKTMNFLVKSSVLNASQHGYMKQKSTNTALLDVIETITEAFDQKEKIQISCCDLSKAFDAVDHGILIRKLEFYGIRGMPLELFQSYLSDRCQSVCWKNVLSAENLVSRGVPQGSILGPVLFIIYLNDLPNNVTSFRACLYADDTSFVNKCGKNQDLQVFVNKTLDEAKFWFNSNNLILNEKKTQQIKFQTKTDNECVSIRFLGVFLDSNLKWSTHIDELSKRLSVAIYVIRRLKSVSTHLTAKTAYFSNFHSLMSYGILLWGTASDVTRIFILQKKL